MTADEWSHWKMSEEAKRARAQGTSPNWSQIAEALTWAEAQLPPNQRRNRPRTHPANRLADKIASL